MLTTITVSPTTLSIEVNNSNIFTASPKDQFGDPFPATITWNSSNTNIGTIDPLTGIFTAISQGSTIITAASGTVSGIAIANVTPSTITVTSNISVITVTGIVPTLTSIAVSPTSASIVPTGTKQFTAVCKDQNNITMACPTLTWLSSNTSIATINSTGLATGVAVAGVVSNTATLTVATTPPSAGAG